MLIVIYLLTNKLTGAEIVTNSPEEAAKILGVLPKFFEMLEDEDVFHIGHYRVQASKSLTDIEKLKNQHLWRD